MHWVSFATAAVNITIASLFFGGWAMTRHRVLLGFAAGYGLYTLGFGLFALEHVNSDFVHAGNISMIVGTLILAAALSCRGGWNVPIGLCCFVACIGVVGELAGAAMDNVQLRHTTVYGALGLMALLGAQAGRRAKPSDGLEWVVVGTLYVVSAIMLTNPRLLTGLMPSLVPFELAQGTWPVYAVLWIVSSQLLAGSLIALAMRDVIEKAQREAVIDPLSGLLNRRGFSAALNRPHRHDDEAALVVVDIDHFKSINDQLGHDVGDEAIVLLSDIMTKAAPAGSCVARLGGEEFAVLINTGGAKLGWTLAQAIQSSIRQAERPLNFTASIGIGYGPHNTLYRRSDVALYEAKNSGRDRICMWQPQPAETAKAHDLVQNALAQASPANLTNL